MLQVLLGCIFFPKYVEIGNIGSSTQFL